PLRSSRRHRAVPRLADGGRFDRDPGREARPQDGGAGRAQARERPPRPSGAADGARDRRGAMSGSRTTFAMAAALYDILCRAALRAQPADDSFRKAADAAQLGDYGQAQELYSRLLSGAATGEKRHQALVASADLRMRTAKAGVTAAVAEAEAAYREAGEAQS